jgi:hypothetical protein
VLDGHQRGERIEVERHELGERHQLGDRVRDHRAIDQLSSGGGGPFLAAGAAAPPLMR